MNYTGIDYHKRYSVACTLDGQGHLLKEIRKVSDRVVCTLRPLRSPRDPGFTEPCTADQKPKFRFHCAPGATRLPSELCAKLVKHGLNLPCCSSRRCWRQRAAFRLAACTFVCCSIDRVGLEVAVWHASRTGHKVARPSSTVRCIAGMSSVLRGFASSCGPIPLSQNRSMNVSREATKARRRKPRYSPSLTDLLSVISDNGIRRVNLKGHVLHLDLMVKRPSIVSCEELGKLPKPWTFRCRHLSVSKPVSACRLVGRRSTVNPAIYVLANRPG